MKKATDCIHAGYRSGNGQPMALPIYQSTTYTYDSTEEIGKIFDLSEDGHMYSRISNPTVEFYEKKLAALEGGVAAVCTTSGQAANFLALFNIVGCGEHFIAASKIYGGTINLFAVTMKRMGIEVRFVTPGMTDDEIEANRQVDAARYTDDALTARWKAADTSSRNCRRRVAFSRTSTELSAIWLSATLTIR